MRRITTAFGLFVGALVLSPASASAGSIGLVADNSCLSYAGVYFCDADIRPTGTGVFQPFLRDQHDIAGSAKTGDGTPTTYGSGWNTGADKGVPNTNDMDHAWTSELPVGNIGTVSSGLPASVPSGTYRLFTVDINQEGKPEDPSSLLSLVQFQLFNCDTANYTSLSDCSSFLDLFPDGTWVDFNYRLHEGSGSGDIDVYVPDSGFAGPYIALLDGWGVGGPDGGGTYADNDGFQEWASRVGPDVTTDGGGTTGGGTSGGVPEPASMALFGLALAGLGYRLRAR